MSVSAARYDRWKAPAEDGGQLIWPAPADLLRDTRDNASRLALATGIALQNVPLSAVRTRMRRWIGHADDAQPIIATGHQTELHHPGVWVKNVLIDAAARAIDGRAVHVAVDTDEPKHLLLRWPGGSAPLADDPQARGAEWSGLVAPPTPAHLRHIEQAFAQAAATWQYQPLLSLFLDAMRRLALTSDTLPASLTNALHQLDWDLGLRYDAMTASPICSSEPYLLFVHHVLARADAFAADYNAALEGFRRQNKIKVPGRPMPNLKSGTDVSEVPFWLDSLSVGSRTRASVVRSGAAWALRAVGGDDEFRFDPAADGWDAATRLQRWLGARGLRLSPRALTLTAVLRLLVADQFVHGIGGGQYDQVLDALIERHLGLEPPRFAVTTATLYFPDVAQQPRVCLPCLAQDAHRMKHAVLGEQKMKLVQQIEGLPRRSVERAQLFAQMHDLLVQAWGSSTARPWEQAYRDAEARAQVERVLFDRELFYAIQSRARLAALIDRYREAFA